MIRVAILAFLLAWPAASQKKAAPKKAAPPIAAPASDKWPIASISIENNKRYTPQQIVAATGLRIGQLAGKADFEAARDRLVSTGLFEEVGYRFAPKPGANEYAAVFQVTEVEPLYPVRFDRLDTPDEELRQALRSKDPFFGAQIPATKVVLDRHAAVIEAHLASKGRPIKVIGKVVSDQPNQFGIVFRPAASEPAIAEVRFQGNEVIPSAALLTNFAGVAYGTPYREPAFRQMLDTGIRSLYEARGRLLVKFTAIQVEKAKTVDGLVLTVTVEEGPSFDLAEVAIEGETPIPPAQLLKAAALKEGDLANFDEVNAGVERMRKVFRRNGFMNAAIEVKRTIHDKPKTVDLGMRVEPGPQFTFGKLKIEGLDIHGEAAIKKLWTLKEGKPYNAEYPEYFLSRVREDGVFDDLGTTKSAQEVNEEMRVVDVTLKFGAAPTEPGAAAPATKKRRRQ